MLIKNPSTKTKNYLKTYFKFDPKSETNFSWARNRGRRMKEGQKAGTFNKDGYVVLSDGQQGKLLGHNVAYYLKTGKWPKKYQAETFRKEFEKTINKSSKQKVVFPLEGLSEDMIYESREEALFELKDELDLEYRIYSDRFYTEEELNSISNLDFFDLPPASAKYDDGEELFYGRDILEDTSSGLFAFSNILDIELPFEAPYFI